MRSLAAAIILLCLSAPTTVAANPVCRWIGLCIYLSPRFHLTVVDADTGKPLADVYAWAEWVQHGAHGIGGPLMVQDAASTADGHLTFSWWGPTSGSPGGLLLGIDPAVILFKPGYATLLVHNDVARGASHQAMIRGLSRPEGPIALQPFRGSPAEWVEQLRKFAFPALSSYLSDDARHRFRELYRRRRDVVATELGRLPADTRGAATLRLSLEQDARFFGGER
jgi:hypothetical protein